MPSWQGSDWSNSSEPPQPRRQNNNAVTHRCSTEEGVHREQAYRGLSCITLADLKRNWISSENILEAPQKVPSESRFVFMSTDCTHTALHSCQLPIYDFGTKSKAPYCFRWRILLYLRCKEPSDPYHKRGKKEETNAFRHNGIYEPYIVAKTMSSALKGAAVPGAAATLPWRQLV